MKGEDKIDNFQLNNHPIVNQLKVIFIIVKRSL